MLLVLLSCSGPLASAETKEPMALSQDFLATRPLYEQPLDDGTTPVPGLTNLSAETCGACHTEQLADWKLSTHSHAWTDRQFQAEITKSGNRWLCLNCHTPLQIQHEQLPVGLEDEDVERPVLIDNPHFDEGLREEGITCAACHVKDGVIYGPGRSTGAAPHPVQASADFVDNEVCLRCHQAVATYPGKGFVCTFETGDEWRAGPYDDEGTGCIDCHMPEGRHWWRGAGIPKVAGVHPPAEANPPGLGLDAAWGDTLRLTMTNANAGHKLPSGDPERWVQVTVTFSPGGEQHVERIGQVWEWWPEPKKLSDNRLAPRESRTVEVPLPEGATGATVVASSHRISAEIIEYHGLDGYPDQVETHRLELGPPEAAD